MSGGRLLEKSFPDMVDWLKVSLLVNTVDAF